MTPGNVPLLSAPFVCEEEWVCRGLFILYGTFVRCL